MRKETVPKGYKRTEVGVIPEEWEITTVGDEFSMQLGKMLDAEKNTGIEKPYLGNRSVQWLKIDCTELGFIRLTPSDLSKFRLRSGDILVCEGGEIGRCAIWEDQIEDCYFQKALHRLRPKRGFNSILFVNILRRYAETGYLQNFVTQTSIAHLPKDKFETIQIACPLKPEQQAIAAPLSDADTLIESLEQLIAKKRQVKQGTMQELLTGKRRLPGFSGKWKTIQLGELANIKTGSRNNQDNVENGVYPFFVRSATVERINSYSHDCEAILIPGEGGIGSIFHYINGKFDVHQRVYAITQFSNQVSGKYIHLYISTHFGAHAMRNSVKATVDSLRLPTFLEFEVNLPPTLPEQTAIAAILTDLDAELETLDAKLDKAKQIKQGMMQQLLTGKVRLVATQPQEKRDLAATEASTSKAHNQPFNEAVLIAVLAGRYGTQKFPLSRFRYTKFLYLFHRHVDHIAQGFRKKAAGPYNPDNRYKGPEAIAQKNQYMERSGGGFVAGPKNADAFQYFEKWYPLEHLEWLDQFRFEKNANLEVLTTVDMACEDLRNQGKALNLQAVKTLIASEPEWLPKLDREIFSDMGIAAAIRRSQELFMGPDE